MTGAEFYTELLSWGMEDTADALRMLCDLDGRYVLDPQAELPKGWDTLLGVLVRQQEAVIDSQ